MFTARRFTVVCTAVVSTAILICTTGCTPAVQATVQPAVGGGLEELTEDENKERINELLQLEGVESTGEHFGRGMTIGAITAAGRLGEELEAMQLQDRTATAFQIIAQHLEQDLGEALQHIASSLTQTVIDTIGAPENRRQARQIAAGVTTAVMNAIAEGLRGQLGPAVRSILVDDLGPGIEHIIEHNIGPGIQRMLDDDFNAALGETTRVIARQAAFGAAEGLADAGVIQRDEPTLMELAAQRLVDITDALGWMFWVLVLVFVALFVVFVGWAARLILQARDVKKKSDLRDDAIVRLAEALHQVERDEPKSHEILEEVAHQMENDDEDNT